MNKHFGKIAARDSTSNNLDNTCNRIQNPKINKKYSLVYSNFYIFR
jgi:hypothetical protein